MTFLHVALLGGIAAIAIPLVLHLIMRQQPKHLEFPALRFIKLRETANRRQMRFRHWLLLALRCALLGLLAIALARPSILASGMLGDQEAPVAAALVFDTNPRMQYRQQNQTRLQVAQETALWLLPQLPQESDVAVVDARTGSATFVVDLGAARQRIERLDASTMAQPLPMALDSALKLVEESDKPRKEIYIFTDLTRATWSPEAMRDFEKRLKQYSGVGIYVIDVGAREPRNYGLGQADLSGEVLSKNSELRINADLLHVGPGGERWVELYLVDRQSGEPQLRDRQQFTLATDASQRTNFALRGLSPGVHQGYLKLVGEDALAVDDTRYFTVEVRPAWRLLLAAPGDVDRRGSEYAFFLSEALAPYAFRVKGEAAFEIEVISQDKLGDQSLDDFAAVCLIDPRPLGDAVWQKLHSFVNAGGGLGVFLGRNATPIEAFNGAAAQDLLPGKLVRQWKAADEVYLAPERLDHPLMAKFRAKENSIPWELSPVFRHWQLGDMNESAGVVLRYSNNQPAIVERPVGQGKVVVLTTPVSDPANRRDVWNLLPTSEAPWPFVMLANELAHYLVGSSQERLNYTTGDTAVVHLSAGQEHPIFSLTTPRGDQIRTPLDERQNAILVTSTEAPGNYRLQAGGGGEAADLGFSANLPASVSQLERATADDLQAIFGDTPFRLAANREEIDRSVSVGRVGQELFPYLIVLLVIVLAAEGVLSNRFYQDYDTGKKQSRAAQLAQRTAGPARETEQVSVSG